MRRVMAFLAACVLSFAASAAHAQKTLRINESLTPGSVEEAALTEFKRLVESGSQGQLQIRIFLNDALGNPQTSLENLMTGSLDLYSGALEYYQPLVPMEIGLMAVPYLLRDHAHMRRYLTSPAFDTARQKLLERGIRFLSTEFNADRGPYRVFISTRPVKSLDDLKGMRIRIYPNEIAVRAWRHLGTVPTVLPHTETYVSLRQGIVEGAPYPILGIRGPRFTEVARFVFRTNEFPQTWPITISERVWRQLSPANQQLLVSSANEAGKLYARETYSRVTGDIEAMRRENNAEFSEIDLDPFRRHMQSFHEQLVREGVVTRELYDAVVKLGQ
jgi:TRAP-type transport system periplasmic protein